MNIQSLSALLAAIVTSAIGGSVVLRDRRRRSFRLFAVLCFVLCLWHITDFLRATLESDTMYFASLFAAIAIPVTYTRFFRVFLTDEPFAVSTAAATPRWMALLGTGLLAGTCYAIALRGHNLHHGWPFTLAIGAYVFGGLYAAMGIVYRKYRRTLSRIEQTRLMYLLVGGLAAITLTACDFLPRLGIPFPAFGNVVTLVYMYFISQTLFRYRLLDINELLGRMVVVATFVLVVAAIYGLLVAWVPTDQPGVFFFNTLVASFVILILYDPLRANIEGQVQKWMFREKYELKARIDQLRGTLANVIDIREAVRLVIASLEESRRATHAAVYLLDAEGGGYDLIGALGPRPVERIDAATRRPFFERVQAVRGPISMEQLEREHAGRTATAPDAETETVDAVARALDEMNAGVCIPIMGSGAAPRAEEAVVGLLAFRDERLREAYATDEIDLFRGLAAQMAITIQNSKLYDRMKERDRLAALGEMAAGLAHEIRNPLGAIKGAAQFLQPQDGAEEAAVPPDAREFLSIIVEEANRLNRVVSQFLDYARPFRGELEPLDVNEVVRKSAQLISPPPVPSGAAAPVEVSLSLAEGLPRARADAEQLRQVFLNLAINAVQAMAQGGKLTISTSVRKGGRRGAPAQYVEVRFRDNGPGIAAAELKNLFIPFYTTKEKGTGLGLPISQRIVENHGGAIEVRSRIGVGSTFTVVLPAFEEEVKRAEAAAAS